MYVGNQQQNTVSAYLINKDGSLTQEPGSPFALGGNSLIADPNGQVLFSTGLISNAIQLNTDGINQDGSLKVSSTVTDDTLDDVRATNPAGTYLYVSSVSAAQENWGWKVYSISSDGSLQFVDGLIDQDAGRLVFTPDGSTAFAAYCYQLLPNIERFTVGSDGMLTNTGNQINLPVNYGECPNAVTLTPAGSMLAAPWSDSSGLGGVENFITLFNVDPTTHELSSTSGSTFPASGAGLDAVFDPSGKFLIAAQDNGIGVYQVVQNSLTEIHGSPFGGVEMDRVMFTPSGSFLVALSDATQQIFVFAFDQSTGALTPAPGTPVSTPSPTDLAITLR
ncbi:MAG TPA: beta-propeller fold lactonase family protein [Terriglobales bacterium]|nr:beta-propeller fold lactonase family protein [Terriglobales bacterium]